MKVKVRVKSGQGPVKDCWTPGLPNTYSSGHGQVHFSIPRYYTLDTVDTWCINVDCACFTCVYIGKSLERHNFSQAGFPSLEGSCCIGELVDICENLLAGHKWIDQVSSESMTPFSEMGEGIPLFAGHTLWAQQQSVKLQTVKATTGNE